MNLFSDRQALQTYKRLLGSCRPYLGLFLLGMLGTVLASITDASLAWLIKPVINKGFIDRDAAFIQWLPIGVVIVFLLRGVTNFTSIYFVTKVGRNIVRDFRERVFQHVLRLPASYYDKHSSGQMLSLISYNTEQVAEASTFALLTIVQEGCLVLGLMVVMMLTSWQLTVLFLITVPFIAMSLRYSSRRMRRYSKEVQHSMADVMHIAEEALEGYQVVRIFGGEAYETGKFSQAVNNNRRRDMKMVATNSISTTTVQLLASIPIAFTLYLATASASQINAGSFAAMIAAMISLLQPMRRLTRVNGMIQKGLAGAESVFKLLDEPVEPDEGKISLQRSKGQIEFKQVHFQYPGHHGKVLTDISLAIQPGETIALVGRSGAGKSTLVSLLPRFYNQTSGIITIDGIDHRDYRLADLRQQFSLVSQQVSLFNDTIAANIAYGAGREVTEAELHAAALAAHALEFIERLPQGFATAIGEDGVLLSGGQRQRLAIARAILKDAPFLILDEATSALDTEAERHIQAALTQLMKNRTTLVIAHRLSTIEKADRICVLDNGSIIEIGSHAELLAQNGHYAALQQMQFPTEDQSTTQVMDILA